MKALILSLLLLLSANTAKSQISVIKQDSTWVLLVDNKPYEVKGVTFGYDNFVDQYDKYFNELNSLGVNTIRTWGTGEFTPQLLNAAESHGIKVMLGIWMRHGRPGMEDYDQFNYLEDIEGMEDMYENAIKVVNKYKNHPAILTWGIGNEVYLNIATDSEKLAYSRLLERIASSIKQIDPNHPITSVEAWTFGLDWWQKHVPSIDIYGLNIYGAGANFISDEMKKREIDKPYIITEYGVTGEWDSPKDKNGVRIEPSDSEKYDAIANGYPNWINSKSNNLGVFVFHYSNNNEFMAPWLFTHVNGMKRPQYWAIREAFTGQKPINYIPEITTFQLKQSELNSGNWVSVDLELFDTENDPLTIQFFYNQRTGSRNRRNQIIALNQRGNLTQGFEIQLPKVDGGIKVFAYVHDSFKNLGVASTSIRVIDEEERKNKLLVPKVTLPFYVYKDGDENPYAPSAYMGNYKDIKIDPKNSNEVHSGKYSFKLAYDEFSNWYGLGFVNPAGDWGDILGGYDVRGAKTFSFWAKSNRDNIKAKVGFGMITKEKPYYDTAIKSMEITIGKKWKKYTLKLDKLDLSCIRTGFTLFTTSVGLPQDIYLDDIVFE